MPAKRRDIAAEHAANTASLQEFVRGFQARELKSLATAVSPLIISSALLRFARSKGRR